MRALTIVKQKGQVSIIVALSLVALIGAVGLATDSGIAYLIKAKLNAAVDSAGLAAGRAVSQGASANDQIANAQAAAQTFFAANYPANYMGSTVVFNNPTVTLNGGQATIDAAASVTVPVSLMGAVGFNLLTLGSTSETLRKNLDLAFVVDTTGSMNVGNVPALVRAGAISFLNKLSQNDDRVALIQFAYGALVLDQINPVQRGFNLASLTAHVNAFNFGGSTNSAEGIWNARDQLNNKIASANRSSLRVIVFLSDGSPNSFSSFFTFANPADCTLAGTISTSDSTSSNAPSGLLNPNLLNTPLGGTCSQAQIANSASAHHISQLPLWYNAHNINEQIFPIVTNTPRVVTQDTSTQAIAWTNVNNASRNLLEAMAAQSRAEGIYVFTLGLDGTGLSTPSGPNSETGDTVLKCMANTGDALPRCQATGIGQPVGVYCHAINANALIPCFDQLASAILRITK